MKKIFILITLIASVTCLNAQFAYTNTTVYTPKGTPIEGGVLSSADY